MRTSTHDRDPSKPFRHGTAAGHSPSHVHESSHPNAPRAVHLPTRGGLTMDDTRSTMIQSCSVSQRRVVRATPWNPVGATGGTPRRLTLRVSLPRCTWRVETPGGPATPYMTHHPWDWHMYQRLNMVDLTWG